MPHNDEAAVLRRVLSERERFVELGAIHAGFLQQLRVARGRERPPAALAIRRREVVGGTLRDDSRHQNHDHLLHARIPWITLPPVSVSR
jgi:hypothetical protein